MSQIHFLRRFCFPCFQSSVTWKTAGSEMMMVCDWMSVWMRQVYRWFLKKWAYSVPFQRQLMAHILKPDTAAESLFKENHCGGFQMKWCSYFRSFLLPEFRLLTRPLQNSILLMKNRTKTARWSCSCCETTSQWVFLFSVGLFDEFIGVIVLHTWWIY